MRKSEDWYSYRFHRDEVKFLRCKLAFVWLKERLDKATTTDGKLFQVQLNSDEVGQIRSMLLDIFCSEGLDNNDEPNSLGLYIENLIDIFSCDFEEVEGRTHA